MLKIKQYNETQVLRHIRIHNRSTVNFLSKEIGINRYQVYRSLVSLQYRNLVEPIPNTYPTVWRFTQGANY